jgi:hypothetical protein
MPFNEATILDYAKELARRDGFEWELEYKMLLPDGVKSPFRPLLNEEDKQKYLARARDELGVSAT